MPPRASLQDRIGSLRPQSHWICQKLFLGNDVLDQWLALEQIRKCFQRGGRFDCVLRGELFPEALLPEHETLSTPTLRPCRLSSTA
jgi:hypothetical protein